MSGSWSRTSSKRDESRRSLDLILQRQASKIVDITDGRESWNGPAGYISSALAQWGGDFDGERVSVISFAGNRQTSINNVGPYRPSGFNLSQLLKDQREFDHCDMVQGRSLYSSHSSQSGIWNGVPGLERVSEGGYGGFSPRSSGGPALMAARTSRGSIRPPEKMSRQPSLRSPTLMRDMLHDSEHRPMFPAGPGPHPGPPTGPVAELIQELGRGANSVVYKGTWCDREVAVKVASPITGWEEEVSIAMQLQHPHIVQFRHYYVVPRGAMDPTSPAPTASSTRLVQSRSVPCAPTAALPPTPASPLQAQLAGVLSRAGTSSLMGIDSALNLLTRAKKLMTASSAPVRTQAPIATPLAEPGCHMVMELCPGGSLRSLLDSSKRRAQPFQREALVLSAQALCALEYMHSLGIVHGDIKAENVLLVPVADSEGAGRAEDKARYSARLADFGCSTRAQPVRLSLSGTRAHSIRKQDDLMNPRSVPAQRSNNNNNYNNNNNNSSTGTPTHLAPELLFGLDRKSPASDIYAVGVTLFEACTGLRPFNKMKTADLWQAKMQSTSQLLMFPTDVGPDLVQLCQHCWEPEPCDRPTAKDVRTQLQQILSRLQKPA